MALHSAIQVFYPSTLVSSDGLYPVRRYVYVLAFALPILMAGLAFVNPDYAYVSQGSFCALPIRPFWYRLAFTWVPRYIIIVVIIGIAIAIYVHVGFMFRGFSNTDSSFVSFKPFDDSNTTQTNTQDEAEMEDITFELNNMQSRPQLKRRLSSVGSDMPRRASAPQATSPPSSHMPQRVTCENGKGSRSLPGSSLNLARSHLDIARPALLSIPSGQSFIDPISPLGGPCFDAGNSDNDKSASIPSPPTQVPTPPVQSGGQIGQAKRRQRIHRQLRLMFIYPLAYTLMWLIPFAMHCMNYRDEYAHHPVEALRVGASLCISLMGFVDALIFSLRERPWRGIESSDGTFWGSFVFYRRSSRDDIEQDGRQIRGSFSGSGRGRGSQSYRTSASGDGARAAAELARMRLNMEREERLGAFRSRVRGRGEGARGDGEKPRAGLNVGDGKEGQVYDDNGLEDDTASTEYNRSRKRGAT